MKRLLTALTAMSLVAPGAATALEEAEDPPPPPRVVLRVELDDATISSVTARFVRGALERAGRESLACVVLELDTPGGLVDSTRDMVKDIIGAAVPVVVFVPPGGRAASAGVFLTLAGHVAAMAPGSNIGAAHPVQIGGLPVSPPSPPGEAEPGREGEAPPGPSVPSPAPAIAKAVNDTAAWARSLAEMRGRNAAWAEKAVRESLSLSAEEAVREGVVDLLARDLEDLLAAIDGREVTLARGNVKIATRDAVIRDHEMWWGERILALISNPNVAFLLLIFGFYGILFELHAPGWGVSGTVGAVLLALGFFGLAVLPIDYAGLLLIALALAMFVAEVFVTSYGALSLGGIICLVLGGLMLVDSPAGFQRVSLDVIVPVAAATALITLILVASVVRAHRSRVQTGGEAMLRTLAVSEDDFSRAGDEYSGTVLTHGERWRAVSPRPVSSGEELEVLERDGLTLRVGVPGGSGTAAVPELTAESD